MNCPDDSGRTFSKHVPRIAASNSFSESEIAVLDFIVNSIMRGGDTRGVLRHKEFTEVARKIKTMKTRIEDMKQERVQEQEKEKEHADASAEGGAA